MNIVRWFTRAPLVDDAYNTWPITPHLSVVQQFKSEPATDLRPTDTPTCYFLFEGSLLVEYKNEPLREYHAPALIRPGKRPHAFYLRANQNDAWMLVHAK